MPKPNRRQVLRNLATFGGAAAAPAYQAAAASPASVLEMRISRYEIVPTRTPWDERVREMAILNWRRENMDVPYSDTTIVKLYTNEGLVGIGDRGSEDLLKRMVGRSPWEFLNSETAEVLPAILDLLGKATGLPACRLLAPNPKKRIIQSYWSLSYPPEMLASEAKRAAGLGYRVHKVKIRPWEDPVAQAHAILAAVPSDYRVWGDANHNWGSVARTLYYAVKLDEIPGYFGVESPVASLEDYRQLRGKTPLRVAEHWGVLSPMLVAREALLDALIIPGPSRGDAGGDGRGDTVFEQNAFARMYDIPLWDETSCWNGIGLATQAHQAAYPGIQYTINAAVTAENDLVKEPFTLKDGLYDIPQRPGLGITLDEDAVDRYGIS